MQEQFKQKNDEQKMLANHDHQGIYFKKNCKFMKEEHTHTYRKKEQSMNEMKHIAFIYISYHDHHYRRGVEIYIDTYMQRKKNDNHGYA